MLCSFVFVYVNIFAINEGIAQKSMFYVCINTEKNVELSIVNWKKLMLISDKLLISLVPIFQPFVTKSGVVPYKSGFGKL